jgi:site-specific DNA-cytosine methylase
MRYLSLFTGIGGFEVAINQVYGDKAVCVGYSEIYNHAIAEYERHYPAHKNLGDITFIKKKDIDALGRIDMIMGGFPCSDLSSQHFADREGLDGQKSGLFWTMLNIINWAKKNNPNLQIIVENNASMANKWRDIITAELSKVCKKKVYCNYFDSSQWVLQRRRRFFWTINKIPEYTGKRLHTQKQVLVPMAIATTLQSSDALNKMHARINVPGASGWTIDLNSKTIQNGQNKTYWQSVLSQTTQNYFKCILTSKGNNVLLDTRGDKPIIRHFAKVELNKLFGYPKNYVKTDLSTIYYKLYGMTVVPPVVVHILQHLQ